MAKKTESVVTLTKKQFRELLRDATLGASVRRAMNEYEKIRAKSTQNPEPTNRYKKWAEENGFK